MDNKEVRELEDLLKLIKSKTENLKPFLRLDKLTGGETMRVISYTVLSPEEQEKKKKIGSKIRYVIGIHDGIKETEYVWETSYGIAAQITAFRLETKCEYFHCKRGKERITDSAGKKGCWRLILSEADASWITPQ